MQLAASKLLSSSRNVTAFTARHDAITMGHGNGAISALEDVWETLVKEVKDDLGSQERLAAFHENPHRMTVIHVAVQLIDEAATAQSLEGMKQHNDDRFSQVIEWASRKMHSWLAGYRARQN